MVEEMPRGARGLEPREFTVFQDKQCRTGSRDWGEALSNLPLELARRPGHLRAPDSTGRIQQGATLPTDLALSLRLRARGCSRLSQATLQERLDERAQTPREM